MSGYIGSKTSVTLVDGYTQAEADAEFVQDPEGSNTDALTDLGATNNRFKDLYLSGGVYLGGTGAANKLDDYETGVFTATLVSTSGTSFTLGSGADSLTYTKIGDRVWVTGRLIIASVTSPASTEFFIDGLPFVIRANVEQQSGSSGSVTYYDSSVGAYLTTPVANVEGLVSQRLTSWRIFKAPGTMGANDQMTVSFSYIT